MSIEVLAYDPQWPDRFAEERTLLERVLAPWLSAGVHHIGSTSVPGLAAKPIIDMMAGIRDLAAARAAIPVLAEHGYWHGPHRPEALWFAKPLPAYGPERTHGLHLTEPGSPLWRERLAFRDALRADPALRDEYQALKLRLAQTSDDVTGYTRDKREFVGLVLANTGIALGPPGQRTDRPVHPA